MSDACEEYLRRLYSYLDGELDEHDRDALRAHLDDCPPCLDEYERDRLVKALIRRSCRQESAPQQLRMQIMTTITTVEVTRVRLDP